MEQDYECAVTLPNPSPAQAQNLLQGYCPNPDSPTLLQAHMSPSVVAQSNAIPHFGPPLITIVTTPAPVLESHSAPLNNSSSGGLFSVRHVGGVLTDHPVTAVLPFPSFPPLLVQSSSDGDSGIRNTASAQMFASPAVMGSGIGAGSVVSFNGPRPINKVSGVGAEGCTPATGIYATVIFIFVF